MTTQRKVLNVGGNNKEIRIPQYYAGFEHLLLDIDPVGKPDIVCDARAMKSLSAAQFDAIYCSHNLEHFFAHDVPKVLSGFLHVLRPDGFAEIRVPDLDLVMKAYVAKNLDIESVLYQSGAGPILVRDVLYGFGKQIERSGVDFYAHKTGFTHASLTRALFAAGFKYCVQRKGRGDFELLVYAFRDRPTDFHEGLLNFKMKADA
ncbi:methyltransferase domain-containing protein [Hyphomonas sp.]|uniref:class I SAM-dependent methyltransferase n=1 Tax=Hyphomonas sp. TaxID=87 RepID=UPI0025B91D68|nr:methyltransferase domain-containing protein [Hyphomonas sp.]